MVDGGGRWQIKTVAHKPLIQRSTYGSAAPTLCADGGIGKDLKNKLVNLSNSKPVPHHHNQVGKVKNFSAGFNASQLLQYAEGIADADNSDMLRGETVQSIEDATGRLSNLVRLMDENSKLNQPSDLTVQSYKSSIIAI